MRAFALLFLAFVMVAQDTDDRFVMLRFSRTHPTKSIQFNDALILTQAEFAALTAAQITALKTARFNAWMTVVNTTPPARPVETRVQLLEAVDGLDNQLADWEQRQTDAPRKARLAELRTRIQEFRAVLP